MERNYTDELYEILDELYSRIEDVVNQHDDPESLDAIVAHIQEKSQEFVDDLQREVEKMELIGMH